MPTADDIIRRFQLQPHPVEGGYFRETYRSPHSTAIYYLLKPGHVSELHVLPSDEVYHFYLGSPLRMLQLWPDGSGREVLIGSDLAAGHVPQLVVPAGVWQGSRLDGDGFALVGCTMAPAFDYSGYRNAPRAELTAKWPAFAAQIAELTPRG
ncbi:MAG TPA: cupin domain-containing protein [Urbifossiella sp.]|nr:cupin domain-containing protein [Urbifossiella sp.]